MPLPGEAEALGSCSRFSRRGRQASLRRERLQRVGVIARVSYYYIFPPEWLSGNFSRVLTSSFVSLSSRLPTETIHLEARSRFPL